MRSISWTHSGGEPERILTRDEMLDDITLYWLTNSATSAALLYWENDANNFNEVDKGGHFAAWEQPQLFAAELRAAFRSLRQAGCRVRR
jgi:pimeloyl-ACP methyl ester carboxylesterase